MSLEIFPALCSFVATNKKLCVADSQLGPRNVTEDLPGVSLCQRPGLQRTRPEPFVQELSFDLELDEEMKTKHYFFCFFLGGGFGTPQESDSGLCDYQAKGPIFLN